MKPFRHSPIILLFPAFSVGTGVLMAQPTGQAELSGTLTLEATGEPLAGVWVILQPAPGEGDLGHEGAKEREGAESRLTFTDAAGRYRFPAVPPGDYDLLAWPNRVVPRQMLRRVTLAADEPQVVDAALSGLLAVSWRFVDAAGQPVPEAHFDLLATALQSRQQARDAVASDAAGRVRFFLTPGSRYRFLLTGPEGWAALEPVAAEETEPIHLGDVVLQPVGSLQGRVVEHADGTPRAEVEVALWPRPGLAWPDEVVSPEPITTDADGRFAFAALPPGAYVLEAREETQERTLRQTIQVTTGEEATEVTVALPTPGQVAGRLLGPDGEPVADADVSFQAAVRRTPHETIVATYPARTDAEGRFHLPAVQPGWVALRVRLPEVGVCAADPVFVPEAEEVAGVELRLSPGLTVAGVVRERASGNPGPGARVALRTTHRWPPFEAATTTGPDGRFRLPHVFPTPAQVFVSAEGFRFLPPLSLPLAAGQEGTDLVLELEREAPEPAADRAAFHGPGGNRETGQPGNRDMGNLQTILRSRQGQAQGPPLLPATGRVQGVVCLPDGETPAVGVTVALLSEEPDPTLLAFPLRIDGHSLYPARHAVFADQQGRFALVDVPAGRYRLYASPTGLPGRWEPPANAALRAAHFLLTGPLEVAAGQTVERGLTLPRGGTLRGVVRSSEGSTPLAEARIAIWLPVVCRSLFGEHSSTVVTDGEGRFELPGASHRGSTSSRSCARASAPCGCGGPWRRGRRWKWPSRCPQVSKRRLSY